ncbi:hypothetical protein FA95DRAFT_1552062 [Auriscalpium vulgare]|uniref:Uncharacterized protein n=1 Tax=Auriscalpium vulgare TaxID=40419 RepID=A0ACB8SBA5_9AGAM|nr:hypothetical protein FA95DRAFT_1552062 [Auriscalpium vulgare]
MADAQKLSLQAFLQLLTSRGLAISRAMAVAGKIYKDFNTSARLGELTDTQLSSLGVADKDDRKLVLSAVVASGYREGAVTAAKEKEAKKRKLTAKSKGLHEESQEAEGSSRAKRVGRVPQPRTVQKKRKRDDTKNEFLPEKPAEEGAELRSLDFDEILDEDVLKHKLVIVNRAPIMMAWSFVVAEKLGFQREEALSIASVYTEMNAISKGVSLGIYDKNKGKDIEASPTGAQPYVDLMGRRIPLYQTADGAWRALSASKPAPPGAAYAYISRALKHTAPAVLGALRLLADSYTDGQQLNRAGWTLYADFRPEVEGWGKRGSVRCETILGLRRKGHAVETTAEDSADVVKYEENHSAEDNPPDGKKQKLDREDDGIMDEDALFEDFTAEDLSALP